MAEFKLPSNSIVKQNGNVFKAPAGATNVRNFKIYRYNPDSSEIRVSTPMRWIWTVVVR